MATAMGILEGAGANIVSGSDVPVGGIAYRSDAVLPGDAFFCISGFSHDGHDFAADAVSRGASVVICERRLDLDVAQFVVPDTRVALALAASAFHDHPSEDIAVVGVTGTNGKTTTTYLVESIMRAAGMRTGIIGTVETRIDDERRESGRTTPESADLHALFAEMRDSGIGGCAMEVSSHAIDLHRVDGVRFAAVAFTNLTQDHLDFHHTIEEYYSVKKRLFDEFDARSHVVNVDDPFGIGIASEHSGALTVGRVQGARIRAIDEVPDAMGTDFELMVDGDSTHVRLPLSGSFNVSNALVAAGCARGMGIELEAIRRGLEGTRQVPGRLERVECGQPFSVIVDYAHTPDSLAKAIDAVRVVTEGRVIVVFGCGGDRDPDKRPMMGRVAGESADYSIITSDNPRTEDPVGIILQVEDGLVESGGGYEVVVDRQAAIVRAVEMAQPSDAVLIAGKGHEDYQIFADRTVHFDDREVARGVLGTC
jgi:UDP-N-acetylmuramoyl-L-alanyl-D-glutamate--2,6-diaminopimelate ligase